MKYISTRGLSDEIGFQDAVMTGLAPDGGLLLPAEIPDVGARLRSWRDLSYIDLALEIMRLYTDVPENDLASLIQEACATFREDEVTPVVKVGDIHVLELFHGPTLSFKDIALQFLGRLFEYILRSRGTELNILAATSGDTGSAAIHGVRGRKGIRIFVMHPRGRVSPLQERQMTTVLDSNVFNMAVAGTFDDCQNIMKSIFRDLDFKSAHSLGSVNSINWARVLAQMVYYFYSAFRVMDAENVDRVQFAVPTGNFGDILAGFMSCRMGLPATKLILATNENDILARFFRSGNYSRGEVHETISPAMDIQIASNFERYLYYRVGKDASTIAKLMNNFSATGRLVIEPRENGNVDDLIVAGSGTTQATLDTIERVYRDHGYLLDPHSAVGVSVGTGMRAGNEPLICVATAHPAKFAEAIRDAVGRDIARHEIIDGLTDLPARCKLLPAEEAEVRSFIEESLRRG